MEKSILQLPLRVLKCWLFYRKSQFFTREALYGWQNERIKHLVRYAGTHVPYYRNLFREIGLDTASFRGIEDLQKIPLLDKEIVRTKREELMSDQALGYGITWDSTSGSTGTPLHFALSDEVQANKIAAFLRSLGWAGYRLGARSLLVQSYYFKDYDFIYKPIYNIVRFDSNRLRKESALKLAEYLIEKPVKVIIGFPFDIMMIGRFAQDAGLKIPSPNTIISYGEKLSRHRREQIEAIYGCKVYDYHSMHELSAMVAECEHGSLHLVEDSAYMEVLDENGTPAREGSMIGTSYYNYTMPLIRYNTRDLVSLSGDECPCGRRFRRVEEIHGKACDHIVTPDGRILGAVMSHSVDQAKGVIVSQCVQDELDHITFRIVVDSEYNNHSQIELEKGLRKRLGHEMKIDFEIVEELEKARGGKTPFIRSTIGNQFE